MRLTREFVTALFQGQEIVPFSGTLCFALRVDRDPDNPDVVLVQPQYYRTKADKIPIATGDAFRVRAAGSVIQFDFEVPYQLTIRT